MLSKIILSRDTETNPRLENPKKYPKRKPQRKLSQTAAYEMKNWKKHKQYDKVLLRTLNVYAKLKDIHHYQYVSSQPNLLIYQNKAIATNY